MQYAECLKKYYNAGDGTFNSAIKLDGVVKSRFQTDT